LTSDDFSVQSDLPAAAGSAASSAFTVSVINAGVHLMEIPRTRMSWRARRSNTGQVLLRENVGVQDQLHASFGGITASILCGRQLRISRSTSPGRDLRGARRLDGTGLPRRSSGAPRAILARADPRHRDGSLDAELREMVGFVDAGQQDPGGSRAARRDAARLGGLLHQAWQVKSACRRGSPRRRSTSSTNSVSATARSAANFAAPAAAGFWLMVVPPERRDAFEQAIGARQCVRFRIDSQGTVLLVAAATPTRAPA